MDTVSYGPNGTAVDGVTAISFPVSPLNFDADFRVIEEAPGKIVLTDLTAPIDQPSTLRIAQMARPNVYAGSPIDPSVYLPTRKGTDTIIELREVHAVTNAADPSYLKMYPFRMAITMTTPDANQVSVAAIQRGLQRLVAALAEQGEADTDSGIAAILHGVVSKG